MRRSSGLLVRGIRWRLGVSILTVLTTTIAVAAAVLGPLYLHTASDSVLRRTVATAPVGVSGITLLAYHDEADPVAAARAATRTVLDATGAERLTAAPIASVESGVLARGSRPTERAAELLDRTGICGHLHRVQSGCHLGSDDAVVIRAAGRQVGAPLGSTVTARAKARTLHLRVVGIAAKPTSGFLLVG